MRTLGAPAESCCCGTRIRGGGGEYPHPVRTNSLAEAVNLLFTASTPRVSGRHVTDSFAEAVLSRKPLERTRGLNVCCYAPDDVAGRET
jgi:hypothetical protein